MGGNKKQLGAWAHKNGVSFGVWAPFAESVTLTGTFNDWAHTLMTRDKQGRWWADVRGAKPGQEYKFVIKNGNQVLSRRDPRARHLVTNKGNSVIVDGGFDWTDRGFKLPPVEQQVYYELHVGVFNRPDEAAVGTFRDAIAKLDYLEQLGINMIEVMPINSMIDDRGWGYGSDYIYAVESLYGGRQQFMEFVDAAHHRGIGVVLDVVYNHLGPDPNLDLWKFDGWNVGGKGGIYFYNDWRSATPWGDGRPDYGRPEVRDYIIDNAAMWLRDCHVDGLRVDSTIYMRNVQGNNNDPSNDLADGWLLLQQINQVARKINPRAVTIAEDCGSNEYITKSEQEGGAGFGLQWELEFPAAVRSACLNPSEVDLARIAGLLTRRYNDNPWQRVVYADSHDTAANGAARFNEQVSPGKANNKLARQQSLLAAALMLTAPGVPMLLMGQEFMQSGEFNDWQGLDWANVKKYHGIVLANKHLIALRKNQANLTKGLTGVNINLQHIDNDNKVMAYHRWHSGGEGDDVMVIVNFGKRGFENYSLSFPHNGNWHVRFNSARAAYSPDFKEIKVPDVKVVNGGGTIVLPPSSVLILSQNR